MWLTALFIQNNVDNWQRLSQLIIHYWLIGCGPHTIHANEQRVIIDQSCIYYSVWTKPEQK